MYNSYLKFEKIRLEKNITNYKIAKDLKLANSVFSDWKRGKSQPKYDKLKLIAEYVGTTPEYLLNETEKETSTPENEITKIRNSVEQKIIEDYRNLDENGKRQLEDYFKYLKSKMK